MLQNNWNRPKKKEDPKAFSFQKNIFCNFLHIVAYQNRRFDNHF